MSSLRKRNARTAKVEAGFAYFGGNYGLDHPKVDDAPQFVYTANIGNRNPAGTAQSIAEEHIIEFTEDQMLEAVHEWMKVFARRRIEERKRRAATQPKT